MDIPQLKKLLISSKINDLGNNVITRVTSLRKGVFKQILAIHLS